MEQSGASFAQPIRVTVQVPLDPGRAFDLFTEDIATWWPLDAYSRAVNELTGTGVTARSLEFRARLGGEILEHLSDGRVLPWGEVVEWDRPRSVAMAWHLHSLPEPPTILEANFTDTPTGTVVELIHRGWERTSAEFRGAMYLLYAEGWPGTMGELRRGRPGLRWPVSARLHSCRSIRSIS